MVFNKQTRDRNRAYSDRFHDEPFEGIQAVHGEDKQSNGFLKSDSSETSSSLYCSNSLHFLCELESHLPNNESTTSQARAVQLGLQP